MLPGSLLIASLTLPWIAMSSSPAYTPSADGYQFDIFTTIYISFCKDLSREGFAVRQEAHGVPIVSLNLVPTTQANKCDQVTFLSMFGTLIQSCSVSNYSDWGTGSLDAGYGKFNATALHPTSNSVGSAANAVEASATGTPVLLSLASTSTSSKKPTTIKPSVRSTAISDSMIFPLSGASLIGVAFIFCFL